MLTCACAPSDSRLQGREWEQAQRLTEVLHYQNNSHLLKGLVGDSGYPSVGFTNIVFLTRSRKVLRLCATKGWRFWLYAQPSNLAKLKASPVLMGEQNSSKILTLPEAPEEKEFALLFQLSFSQDQALGKWWSLSVSAVTVQKFMLHKSHERGERVGVG